MVNIPRSALVLGLAGVLPFFWGVATLYSDALSLWTLRTIGPRFNGPYVQVYYGAIILSFMSGVLWGFATKSSGRQATIGYILSVLPALWAFFMTGNGPTSASIHLMTGFAGLLLLDWFFWLWHWFDALAAFTINDKCSDRRSGGRHYANMCSCA